MFCLANIFLMIIVVGFGGYFGCQITQDDNVKAGFFEHKDQLYSVKKIDKKKLAETKKINKLQRKQ